MALALCALGVGTYSLRAAERVDTTKTVKITAEVDVNDGSVFASKYEDKLYIRLYKIAALDETGKLTGVTSEFSGAQIDLTVLDNNPTVEDVEDKIVYPALGVVENIDNYNEITIDRGQNENKGSATIDEGAGLYLYVPQMTKDNRYYYYFTSYVIMVPSSEYIVTGSGSDEWNYEATFKIKSRYEERHGGLRIVKNLDNYNVDLSAASFIYKVKATLDDKVIYDDVLKIEFDAIQPNDTQPAAIGSRELYFPAEAKVTVTEVYEGASYKVVGENKKEDIIIKPFDEEDEEPVEVVFENEYDDTKLISGGISAVNTYEKIDGEYVHVDDSPR